MAVRSAAERVSGVVTSPVTLTDGVCWTAEGDWALGSCVSKQKKIAMAKSLLFMLLIYGIRKSRIGDEARVCQRMKIGEQIAFLLLGQPERNGHIRRIL